ncbi:DegT/DnrJ/EryC1/StrS family aminotransferase [Methanosarcina sp.]|uniref:DegT/DnrJ/EryC1/StrS family aminotransferase n=1 Tax=Methanosarcina sp. TaxID=2213 RepID=UPI002AB85D32|nr:DegT/DnrJ/EryC1/StrS family aminotransferase [Methanosarcina sp.]MDY9926303.1 DegT/DnrJ/EryC1/StrS family aminotransferase [Methanosarcina sp.]
MSSIKPDPMLIPRFNIDYGMKDFIHSLTNLKTEANTKQLTELFCNSAIEFTNSGRTSLYVILKALNLPANSNVGVPLYCCPSVFDAIIQAGHRPLFLDIDPDNYTVNPEYLEQKIDEIEAVIVIHTFGRPADLDKIQKIAGEKPVIEDCAHALLSKYKGKLAGTIATAGFFSFRTGKYISAGEGGMVTTRNPELAENVRKEIQKLPEPSGTDEIKHTIKTCARSTLYHRPWFGLVSLPIGSRIEDKVDLMNKYSFKTARIRNTDLQVVVEKLQNFQEKVEQQRKNSQYLIENLKDIDLKLPFETKDTYCNYYLFPVQTNSQSKRDEVSESLIKRGIDTAKLFSKTPAIAKNNYEYKEGCPNTEKVAENILIIPNHFTLNKRELDQIINAIKMTG